MEKVLRRFSEALNNTISTNCWTRDDWKNIMWSDECSVERGKGSVCASCMEACILVLIIPYLKYHCFSELWYMRYDRNKTSDI
jgi:hypothetical protein